MGESPFHPFLLWGVLLLGSGCALTDAHLKPSYAPRGTACMKEPIRVAMRTIDDSRPEPYRVGVKKNGYGWDTADALLVYEGGATGWMQDALREELRRAGFELAGANDSAALDVSADLKQLYVEVKIGFWAGQLHGLGLMEVFVTLPDGRRFARVFKAHQSGSEMVWTDSDYQRVFVETTQALASRTAWGICRLLLDTP